MIGLKSRRAAVAAVYDRRSTLLLPAHLDGDTLQSRVSAPARVLLRHARGDTRRTATQRRCYNAALAAVLFVVLTSPDLRAGEASPSPSPEKAATAETIESSGAILGVRIGMTMKEARETLKPLRDPDAPRDEREKFGTRAYWKLLETEYEWIMAWANRDGKITRIRAVLRPDSPKPFSEIGDLSRAVTNAPHAAAWNAVRDNIWFRITAFGNEGRAVRISILAFDPSLPEPPPETDEPE